MTKIEDIKLCGSSCTMGAKSDTRITSCVIQISDCKSVEQAKALLGASAELLEMLDHITQVAANAMMAASADGRMTDEDKQILLPATLLMRKAKGEN